MSTAQKFTDDSFEQDVLNAEKPVLVDFWAEWCGPCRIVGPVVEELAEEYEDKVKIGKVNVDENQVAANYGIRSIPTLLIFKNCEVVDQIVGAVPKSQLKKQLDAQLTN
jgi:thioredoxin 1